MIGLNPLVLSRPMQELTRTSAAPECVHVELGPNDRYEIDALFINNRRSLVWLSVRRAGASLELIQYSPSSHKTPDLCHFTALLNGTLLGLKQVKPAEATAGDGPVESFKAQFPVGRATFLEIFFNCYPIANITLLEVAPD